MGAHWDFVITLDDATSEHYSMCFVEEQGTASGFQGMTEVIGRWGLPSSLYTDRGSHYWYTPETGGKVDRDNPTQFARAMRQLGVEMIPAYSPEAGGRCERMFATHQQRLPKEFAAHGIDTMAEANRYLAEHYRSAFNDEFAVPAAEPGTAFVPAVLRYSPDAYTWFSIDPYIEGRDARTPALPAASHAGTEVHGESEPMTKETYQLDDGRSVIIDVDDLDYGVTVTAHPAGENIGYMKVRLIEMPSGSLGQLHLTHAFLDEAGRDYLRKGIGRRCLNLIREASGLPITASEDDGQRREDGSHLTGDAPGFVAKMREEGLIEGVGERDRD